MSAERDRDGAGRTQALILFVVCIFLPCLRIVCAEPTGLPCRTDTRSVDDFSLATALDLALCSNAQIQSAAAAVRVRAAQLGESHSAYWPSLSATITELRESTQYPGSTASAVHDSALTGYAALDWKLLDFGGRRADSRAAAELLGAAMAARDATVQKVFGQIVEAYYDAVTARALLDSDVEDQRIAKETLESAQRRLLEGEAAQSDLLQAKTALERLALEVIRARGSYDKSLAVLVYDIGLPADTRLAVVPDEAMPSVVVDRSLSDWLQDARLHHPALVSARAEVAAAESQVEVALSSGRPTLDLQANYYANGFPQQGLATSRQRSTTIGLALSIPVFDGFLNRYKVHEARANVDVKLATLADTEQMTLADIVKAYPDATTASAGLHESLSLLDAAAAAQLSAARRYSSGAGDILELLSRQRALADARQERVRSLADWHSAQLRLLATTAVLTVSAAKANGG